MVALPAECVDRLLTLGAAALSEEELLTVLIDRERPENPAHLKARNLLEACGGIRGLFTCDREIAGAQHLDRLQSAAVLAAVELSRRFAQKELSAKPLDDPETAVRYLHLLFGRPSQMVLGAVFVDLHRRPVGQLEAFRGGADKMVVEPRPILREAIRCNARGVLLFEIRPSAGAPLDPQAAKFAARMQEACQLVGLELLDYLILDGAGRWSSVRRVKPW